jgi:hypothetical protein
MGLKRVPKVEKQAIAVKLAAGIAEQLAKYIAWLNEDATSEPVTQAEVIEAALVEFIAKDKVFQARKVTVLEEKGFAVHKAS